MTHVAVQLWSGGLVLPLDHVPDTDELMRIAHAYAAVNGGDPPRVRTVRAFARRRFYEVP